MSNGCRNKSNVCVNEGKGGGNKVSAGRCCNFLRHKISYHSFIDIPLQGGEGGGNRSKRLKLGATRRCRGRAQK